MDSRILMVTQALMVKLATHTRKIHLMVVEIHTLRVSMTAKDMVSKVNSQTRE